MVTKQQLQNMIDETIEELQKPTSEGGPMGQRYRQLLFHRANLEMKLRDLENPPEKIDEPEPEELVHEDDEFGYGYYGYNYNSYMHFRGDSQ